ncbi:flavin reductase [bacterium]|nr:flavin reductase [bacterium]
MTSGAIKSMVDAQLESRKFLDTLGLFATGVCVVTTQGESAPHGMTANAITSLSLDPMQVIFCVAKRAQMADHLTKPGARFTINILRDEQIAISNHFAARSKDSAPDFRFVEWEAGPRIEGALAAIGCEVASYPEGGDHWIVVGRVIALYQGIEPHNPLLYFKSRYRNLSTHEGESAPARLDMQSTDTQLFLDPWGA